MVIGGGVGGVAAAIGLRRAGIDVVVFEQQQDARSIQVGGGIHLWTNAMRALRELGLDDAAGDIGAPIERTEYRDSHGRLLATWPVGDMADEHGVRDYGVSRAQLQQLLVARSDEGVIQTGRKCTGFEQDADGIVARFADGGEERGAALIGADGLRSTIRERLLGPQALRYDGYTQFQSIVQGLPDSYPPEVEQVIFGCRNRCVLHPVSGDRLFWTAAMYGPQNTLVNEPKKQTLLSRFGGWGAVAAAIEGTPEEAIWGGDIFDRPPVDRWGEGRVTLLGDAAHPLTTNLGQGANQALEDAAVLANCFRGATDYAATLREYERRRIKRTSAVVKRSYSIARAGALRPAFVCTVRDRMMGLALRGPGLKGHRALIAEPL